MHKDFDTRDLLNILFSTKRLHAAVCIIRDLAFADNNHFRCALTQYCTKRGVRDRLTYSSMLHSVGEVDSCVLCEQHLGHGLGWSPACVEGEHVGRIASVAVRESSGTFSHEGRSLNYAVRLAAGCDNCTPSRIVSNNILRTISPDE